MTSCVELRKRIGLTQAEMARFCGVSQAAIAAYETGRRKPTGVPAFVFEAIGLAVEVDTIVEDLGRGKTTTYPANRWPTVTPLDAEIVLPTRLDWSHRRSAVWRLADLSIRSVFYALVLDEGDVVDIQVFLDPDELIRLSDQLPVSRTTRAAVDRLVDRLRVDSPAAAA